MAAAIRVARLYRAGGVVTHVIAVHVHVPGIRGIGRQIGG